MINCEFENGHKASLRHVTVDAIVIKKNKILLVKRAKHLSECGKYVFPGGFLDRDETTREGVLREVKEETGYDAKATRLFLINDNPDRGEDRQNITFVYFVEVEEKTGEPDNEVETVEWFGLDDLPPKEKIAFDHYEIIQSYLDYKKREFPLPKIGL